MLKAQCERCGCSPCDCKGKDRRHGGMNTPGVVSEHITREQRRIEDMVVLILSRPSLPAELKNADLDTIESYLSGKLELAVV